MGETELLVRHLEAQRRHILSAVAGLTDEQLRQAVLPSGWSLLELFSHLTIGDEHYWFECVVKGSAPFADLPAGPRADWLIDPAEPADTIIKRYQAQIDRSNAITASAGLDAALAQPDPKWGEWAAQPTDLRSVILHMITETAVHAGHVDAVCELLDGRQWSVQD
jgi:uncharacterized damage-inducible protein DinB